MIRIEPEFFNCPESIREIRAFGVRGGSLYKGGSSASTTTQQTFTETKDNRVMAESGSTVATDGGIVAYLSQDAEIVENALATVSGGISELMQALESAGERSLAVTSKALDAVGKDAENVAWLLDKSRAENTDFMRDVLVTLGRDSEARRESETQALLETAGKFGTIALLGVGGLVVGALFLGGKRK